MAFYRRFVFATMLFLVTLSLIQPTFSRGCGKPAGKHGRLSMEYLKEQHNGGITERVLINSTNDQALSKLTYPQIQGETNIQENAKSKLLRQGKMKPKLQCKREIPGGPDPQHH